MALHTARFVAIIILATSCLPSERLPDGGNLTLDASMEPTDVGVDGGNVLSDSGVDSGIDASVDAAIPDAGTLTWATSATHSRPRNHHFSCIVEVDAGAFLFAVGGVEGMSSVLNNVDRYQLTGDGGIFTMDASVPLLVAAGGMSGAVVGNTILIAGGMTSTRVTNFAYRATVQRDGTLSSWQAAGNTQHQRMHSGAFSLGDDVYIIGGINHPTVWDDVVKATKQADGSFSAWTTVGTLPGPRSHFFQSPASIALCTSPVAWPSRRSSILRR